MKILVVFYSWKGKTRLVASSISKVLGADLKEIKEIEERRGPFSFLSAGYSAARGECSKIKPFDFKLEAYDLIFLGTPVWAMRPAPAVNAFISKAKLKGKKFVLFATMGIFGGKKTISIVKEMIEAKQGRVVSSFIVKTGGVKREEMIRRAEEIAKKFIKQGRKEVR